MTDFIRILLPIYFIIYFGIAFVVKSIIVAKRIGKNPVVLPKDESAYGLIGIYFKITIIGIFVYVLLFSIFPKYRYYFLPIAELEKDILIYFGIVLLILALIWTIIAQKNMKNSWRIGIDSEMKTELITNGLFSISRNPIFFGMIISLIGLFLITPNSVTLIFLVLGYVLIQIQIRLEEEHLTKINGEKYTEYKNRTRRLI
jgi:protein-S-isoprenylcysteine O-methyltransferase Ste14